MAETRSIPLACEECPIHRFGTGPETCSADRRAKAAKLMNCQAEVGCQKADEYVHSSLVGDDFERDLRSLFGTMSVQDHEAAVRALRESVCILRETISEQRKIIKSLVGCLGEYEYATERSRTTLEDARAHLARK